MTSDSRFLRHEPCFQCGSSDALAVYSNGGEHCFSCGYHKNGGQDLSEERREGSGITLKTRLRPIASVDMSGKVSAIPDRRISQDTCERFGVTVTYDTEGNVNRHHYPYYDNETGELVASKIRDVEPKGFRSTGDLRGTGLFGMQACRGKGKYITITEGELDAMSVSEMFGNKWDVVSLKSGAHSAAKDIKEHLDWLEGYETVVIYFDQDKAGKAAVEQVKDLFSPNKLKIVTTELKDANEMLKDNSIKAFVQAWWDAKVYRPDGIVAGVDTWEALVNKRNIKSVPYPWEGLNELTRGHRAYELVTITSGSGMGKSQFIRELEYDLLQRTDANIGILALEEDVPRATLGVMSVAANRPLHLEEDTSVDDLRPFWEATLGTGRYYLFDHWGSTSADNLLSRVRYMAKALDCRYVVLDHLSIVVSSQENGDERKAIDEIMTRLRTLVAETGITLFLVSHLKRVNGKPHEDGGKISLQDLRGSQSIAQLSDIVIGMERDQQHEDIEVRNTTSVRVLKNRYSGQTGPACWLRYDLDTGRMVETAPPSPDDEVEF